MGGGRVVEEGYHEIIRKESSIDDWQSTRGKGERRGRGHRANRASIDFRHLRTGMVPYYTSSPEPQKIHHALKYIIYRSINTFKYTIYEEKIVRHTIYIRVNSTFYPLFVIL